MIVKLLTHIHMVVYTWWCTLGEVGTFTKEMKLELMWINSVKKWRRKEKLHRRSECGQSDGATGALDRKDRVSQSGPDAGHIVTGRWGPASGQS